MKEKKRLTSSSKSKTVEQNRVSHEISAAFKINHCPFFATTNFSRSLNSRQYYNLQEMV